MLAQWVKEVISEAYLKAGQEVSSCINSYLMCVMSNQAGAEQLQSLRLMGYFCSYDRGVCPIEIGFAL